MSKIRTIENLVTHTSKRVYVYLSDEKTERKFIADAKAQGYTFQSGANLSAQRLSNFYAVNRNKTINHLNSIGRIAFQCNSEHIIKIDYKKYINGNEDYYYG